MEEKKNFPGVKVKVFKALGDYGACIIPNLVIVDENLSTVLFLVPEMLRTYKRVCLESASELPYHLMGDKPIYCCDAPSLIAIIGNEGLVATESGLSPEKIFDIFLLKKQARENESKQILQAVHHIGEKLSGLDKVDFTFCSHVPILTALSGLRRSSVEEYVEGSRKPQARTANLLLQALHQHGEWLKTLCLY